MDSTQPLTLTLAGGATHCIDQARGLIVRAMRGRVWLTITGMPDDVVLDAGDSFEAPCDGRMVIEPMEVGGNDGSAIFEICDARQTLPGTRHTTGASSCGQASQAAFPCSRQPVNQA